MRSSEAFGVGAWDSRFWELPRLIVQLLHTCERILHDLAIPPSVHPRTDRCERRPRRSGCHVLILPSMFVGLLECAASLCQKDRLMINPTSRLGTVLERSHCSRLAVKLRVESDRSSSKRSGGIGARFPACLRRYGW